MAGVTVMASTAWPGSTETSSMPRLRLASSSAHMASAQARASAVASMSAPPPGEDRRALLHEGAHAFRVIRRRAGLALEVSFEVELGGKAVRFRRVERALGQRQPDRRRGGKMGAQLLGFRHQRAVVDRLPD